jgi:hypothetical protein
VLIQRPALRLLAASAILSVIASCSTRPSLELPVPDVCFQACRVQTCVLSKFYTGKADEARASEELNCTEVNGAQARYCAELKRQCADGLKAREKKSPGS